MSATTGVVAGMVVGGLVVAIVALFVGGPAACGRRPPRHGPLTVDDVEAELNRHQSLHPGRSATTVLTEPPMIVVGNAQVTLKEWLVHFTRREGVWTEVVSEFYARAAGDVHVAPYFASVDLDDLRRHFLAVLLLIADKGLTVGTVRKMHDRHSAVRDLQGEPITGEIYDRVVAMLTEVIGETLMKAGFLRPEPIITQLAGTIAPLREAIVKE